MKNILYITLLSIPLTACLSYEPSALKDPNQLYKVIATYPKTKSCDEATKKCDLQLTKETAINLKILSERSGNMLVLNYDKDQIAADTAALQNTNNLLGHLGITHSDKIVELITSKQEKLNASINSNVSVRKTCTQKLTPKNTMDTSIVISVNPGTNCNIIMSNIF